MFTISAKAKIVGDGTTAIDASGGVSKLIGATNDITAYALQVEDVNNNALLYVRNDGYVRVGNVSGNLIGLIPEFEIGKSKNGAVISAITNTSTGANNQKILAFYQNDTAYTTLTHLGPNAGSVSWGYSIPNHFIINNLVSSKVYSSGIILGGNPIIFYNGNDVKDGSAKLEGSGLYISSSADIYNNSANVATARIHVVGSSTTSTGFGLKIENSNNGPLLYVRNDGNVGVNIAVATARLHVVGTTSAAGAYAIKVDDSVNSPLLYVQNDGTVGIGTNAPDISSILDIVSTNKGVLLPRMTTAQRNAISTPANGLQIYNTSTTSPNYYDGTTWQQVTNKAYVDVTLVTAQISAKLFNYYNFI